MLADKTNSVALLDFTQLQNISTNTTTISILTTIVAFCGDRWRHMALPAAICRIVAPPAKMRQMMWRNVAQVAQTKLNYQIVN